MKYKNFNIAVVYAGKSSEWEISIKSKNAICAGLKKLDYDFCEIELSRNISLDLQKIENPLVINATHGTYGEDGRLPALLDILEIPYSHSNSNSSQIAMNKLVARKLAGEILIKQPQYCYLTDFNNISKQAIEIMKKPFVIKPVSEGSSVGIEIILDNFKNFKLNQNHFKYGNILLEEYIKGQEVNVAIIDDKAIGTMEVVPEKLFYDYEAKYLSNKTDYIYPAKLSPAIEKKILEQAEKIHNFFGCNYLSRVEFLVKDGDIYFLELNTQPGFTKTSIVPKIAAKNNISFKKIILGLIKTAKHQ